MRIIFGIMSAVQPVATVVALCDAIGASHPVLIHHDFSQQPDFVIKRPQVAFVADPQRTGWATWGFNRGILKLIETALARDDWDFFQLLSPSCLPVRPIDELKAHLKATGADYYIDAVDIASEDGLMMSHGWRAYAAQGQLRHRILRRARRWYVGTDPTMRNRAGLSYPVDSKIEEGGFAAFKARLGLGITRLAQRRIGFNHIFAPDYPCHAGTTWFGASRQACSYLMTKASDDRLLQQFRLMHMPDEMMYPTVFRNSALRGAPAIHYLSRFVEARPALLTPGDLDDIAASGYFFARKFPEAVDSEVRLLLAARLGRPPDEQRRAPQRLPVAARVEN